MTQKKQFHTSKSLVQVLSFVETFGKYVISNFVLCRHQGLSNHENAAAEYELGRN